MKAGRPTKYEADFHPNDFIRLSKMGKTLMQIAFEWDVDRETVYTWGKKHPIFLGAIKKGREYAESYYANLGHVAMLGEARDRTGKKLNVNLGFYCWLTKNLFKWSDRIESQIKEDPTPPKKKDNSRESIKKIFKDPKSVALALELAERMSHNQKTDSEK